MVWAYSKDGLGKTNKNDVTSKKASEKNKRQTKKDMELCEYVKQCGLTWNKGNNNVNDKKNRTKLRYEQKFYKLMYHYLRVKELWVY